MKASLSPVVEGALKIAVATGLFAAVHSLLATRSAKRTAERVLGTSGRNALYRPFYLIQSMVTFGALVVYYRRQDGTTLYRVEGGCAALMRAGQVLGLIHAVRGAHHVDITRILGLEGLSALVRGRRPPPEPEAQGPAREDRRGMKVTGPFRLHRHPLNFAPLPVLWLFPRMTTRLLALNIVSTAYLVLGSLHEEVRLRSVHGRPYAAYQESGIPFFLPLGQR